MFLRFDSSRDMPVRACMLSFYFPPNYSGSAIQALSVSRELRGQGVECFIVSANLADAEPEDVIDGILIYRLRVSKRPGLQIPSFWLSLSVFLWKNRSRYDVIHAHGTIQHTIAGLVGNLLGKPTFLKIAMAHSDVAFSRQGRVWGRLQRFLVSQFDHYIATSSEVKRELAEEAVCEQEAVLSIPNGVDMLRFGPYRSSEERMAMRAELDLPACPIVLFVGIIASRKNIDTILSSWTSIKSASTPGHLVLVGPVPMSDQDGEYAYYQEQLEFLGQHGIADSVSFVGYKDEPTRYFQASDIFFFPSRREGMPNVVIESMAAGMPCVVAKFSGAADLIQRDVSDYIEEADAAERFSIHLERLLTDPQHRERMGQQAWKAANERFSLQSVAARLKTAYEASLAARA